MDILWWAIIALIVAIVAGALGFTGVASGAATISKWLFAIFLIIAIVIFIAALLGGSLLVAAGGPLLI